MGTAAVCPCLGCKPQEGGWEVRGGNLSWHVGPDGSAPGRRVSPPVFHGTLAQMHMYFIEI